MDVKSEIDADKNANKLKSCFWILHKLVQKGEFGEIIEKKYGVGHKIYEFYLKTARLCAVFFFFRLFMKGVVLLC